MTIKAKRSSVFAHDFQILVMFATAASKHDSSHVHEGDNLPWFSPCQLCPVQIYIKIHVYKPWHIYILV